MGVCFLLGWLARVGMQRKVRYIYISVYMYNIYTLGDFYIFEDLLDFGEYFKRYLLFASTDSCFFSKVLVNRLNIMVLFSVIIQ